MSSDALFCVDDLSVAVDGHEVLHALSLRAQPGDWIVLLGPNGAGKSSALRACAGLVEPSRSLKVGGRVLIDGHDLSVTPRRTIGRLVAAVPQTPTLPDGSSVFDYVLLGRTPHLGWLGRPGARDRAIAAALLERLDLSRFAHRMVTTLSGGERQRAVIARALAQEAPVLVLDEPTSALDVGHQQQVLELVDELRVQRGLVVLSAMHDLVLAGQYAHHLVLLVDGVGVGCGAPSEVLLTEQLERHYSAHLRSVHLANGGVAVFPTRPVATAAAAANPVEPITEATAVNQAVNETDTSHA